MRDELREEGDIEHTDLGIEKIGQRTGNEHRGGIRLARALHDEALPRMAQHPVAHENKIGGSHPSQYRIGKLRSREQRPKTERNQRGPAEATGRNSHPRERGSARVTGRSRS